MPEEHKRSKIELIKEASRGLRGNIGGELVTESSHFSKESVQLLKFHGIYQQEDRDQRKIRRRTGREKAYQFMVRIKNPGGGRLTPEQWVVLDDIADLYGEGSMRITTRQGIQFHGVGKVNLKEAIQYLDRHRVSTFGACGDGNRNTMACPVSGLRKDSCFDGGEWAARIAERFALGSSAYFEIWLDGEKVEQEESEPLYGKTYLPRKFKIAVGDPHDNCVDLLSNDVGLLPVLSGGTLEGFDVFVGGGLGSTHLKAETYPRLADPLGFVLPAKTLDLLESIILTQRDLGNREDRRQARMKYLVEKLGIAAFRREVESRLGERLLGLRPWSLGSTEHHLGWNQQRQESRSYLGIFVENGRVEDRHDRKLKTGLRALIELARPTVFLTPNQDLILADIPEEVVSDVRRLAQRFGLVAESASALRTSSFACPALPTCGLAITEAERRLPSLIDELEEAGFGHEQIKIRMSGCPNSCSRPPVAEIGLVGKSVNGYNLLVGGNRSGTRLAELLFEDVRSEDLASEIGRLIRIYRRNRRPDEHFGDFCHRVGVESLRSHLAEEIAV